MTRGLAGAIEFIRLEEKLREFVAGKRFIYIPNPGNWGDGLIRYATERFFRQHGFDYVSINFPRALRADRERLKKIAASSEVCIVYGGGGLFIEKYARTDKIPELVSKSDRMLVLPNTFGMSVEKLGFRKFDILFRRDHGGSKEFAQDSFFCHDMALWLGSVRAGCDGIGTGYFFRKDAEKIEGMILPEGNRDISTEGTEQSAMAGFFHEISQFETIHTNRLHVSIAAAMMGRRVHLYANSYFKNESIYGASLREAFPNVSFHHRFDYAAEMK